MILMNKKTAQIYELRVVNAADEASHDNVLDSQSLNKVAEKITSYGIGAVLLYNNTTHAKQRGDINNIADHFEILGWL